MKKIVAYSLILILFLINSGAILPKGLVFNYNDPQFIKIPRMLQLYDKYQKVYKVAPKRIYVRQMHYYDLQKEYQRQTGDNDSIWGFCSHYLFMAPEIYFCETEPELVFLHEITHAYGGDEALSQKRERDYYKYFVYNSFYRQEVPIGFIGG